MFHTLRDATGAAFECFASPLNTFFGRFCGAFPDVDAPFGSSGDFFALPAAALKRGCFQANPPFVSAVMTAGEPGGVHLTPQIKRLLSRAVF